VDRASGLLAIASNIVLLNIVMSADRQYTKWAKKVSMPIVPIG